MKLAIVGYGKMGKMIERLAPEYGFTIAAVIDAGDSLDRASAADVAIEFSIPEAVLQNVEGLTKLGVPVVVGTTGWLDRLDAVKSAVAKNNGALIWSPNFSVGVNVFFRLVAEAAKLLATENDYGAWAWEIHHGAKKDAPSGTLLKLVEQMKSAGYSRSIDVSSNRAGAHPGTHEIGFDSQADTITLKHSARSREGFARGALKAAQWIQGRKGVFEFSEVLFAGRTEPRA
jgi:4-hydroxy-tetrahydrodipicolinate reductase